MLNVEVLKAKRNKKFEQTLAPLIQSIDSNIDILNDQGTTVYTRQVIQLAEPEVGFIVDAYTQNGFTVSATNSTAIVNSQTVQATNITFRW